MGAAGRTMGRRRRSSHRSTRCKDDIRHPLREDRSLSSSQPKPTLGMPLLQGPPLGILERCRAVPTPLADMTRVVHHRNNRVLTPAQTLETFK